MLGFKKQLLAALLLCFASPLLEAKDYGCLEWGLNACLQDGRFFVEAYYTDHNRKVHNARIKDAVIGDEASLFYFFNHDNPELLVKVLNACAVNGKYWVFGSAGTDLDYSVYITDLATNKRKSYKRNKTNPLINDAGAFACSP